MDVYTVNMPREKTVGPAISFRLPTPLHEQLVAQAGEMSLGQYAAQLVIAALGTIPPRRPEPEAAHGDCLHPTFTSGQAGIKRCNTCGAVYTNGTWRTP